MTSLPNDINYNDQLPSLPPETQVINVTVNPSNASTFTPGSQIQLDLINRGFLIPDSLWISYDYSLTQATTADAEMKGIPCFCPFQRQSVQIGSQTVDTINNYNVLMTMLANLGYTVGEKLGMPSLGYGTSVAVAPNLQNTDGRLCDSGLTDTGSFSGPLMSILSNSEKLLPLFAMGSIRINLTIESIANMFTTTKVPSAFSISNFTLHYKIVDFSQDVERMIMSMGPKIFIKSQSFGVSSQTLTSGANGSQELIFNQRYASCKSIFAINGTSTAGGNTFFDSVNLAANSEYSFMVAGVQYPQRPISTARARTQALMELKSATGSIFDKNNSHSISAQEYAYDGTDAATTYNIPGKFYVGTSLEKLHSDSLLTGISTQSSNIGYRVNLGGATASTVQITLVVNHDSIWEIDLINKDVLVRN